MEKASTATTKLLLELFDQQELKKFLGRKVAQAVCPTGGDHTAETWVAAVVEKLDNRGLLDDTFFDRLEGKFPQKQIEIGGLRRVLRYGGFGPEPSAETTGAIILGARDFTAAGLGTYDAFARSAAAMKDYLRDSAGLGLPDENIRSLFEADEPAPDIDAAVDNFLQDGDFKDVIICFAGCGWMQDGQLFLGLKSTRKADLRESSYRLSRLAKTMELHNGVVRRLLILDCVFPEAARGGGGIGPVGGTPAVDMRRAAEFPFDKPGLAVLCASTERRKATAAAGENAQPMTAFTGGILGLLRQGIGSVKSDRLTIQQVGLAVRDHAAASADGATQVAFSQAREDDPGSDPFFPNPAYGKETPPGAGKPRDETFEALLDKPAEIHLPSSTPILIAIEQAAERLSADELVRGEAHLTIMLGPQEIDRLEGICEQLRNGGLSFDETDKLGRETWEVLRRAEPRMEHLFDRVAQATYPQPIAWAGRTQLLLRIHLALLVARRGLRDGAEDLLSVSFGDHYFHPLSAGSRTWGLERRVGRDVVVATTEEGESAHPCEIAAIRAARAIDGVHEIVAQLRPGESRRTRVALGFGTPEMTAEELQDAVALLPCVSLGPDALWTDGLRHCLQELFPACAPRQAAPSMIAEVRRAILRKAREDGDAERYLSGAAWSSWAWTGRPLFVEKFGETDGKLHRAMYPHLTDLRGLGQPAWNFRREEGIPAKYRAWALADVRDPDSPRDERFHLYLSGAGGTGKSCLLKDVHDLLGQKPEALPVWYRVDAPGLPWEQVETRLMATIEETVRRRYPEGADDLLPPDGIELGPYLTRLARNIQNDRFRPLQEVVVFIDQLERTFESGDQPEFDLLSRISAQVTALLKQVEDCPVRVFIASRKQYLPDFLGSYQEASETGLHFNILQKIDRNERSAFVNKIFKYCRDTEKIIDEDFEFRAEAIDQLTHSVHGHPLEIVLALIHLFSQADSTDITEEYIRKLAPREHLFDFDIMLADKDPLDRYFLYAMAHARAEIVGFDEVWWRLHLVDPRLTERVERLNQRGVVEWLWLKGHLGRSILPREDRRGVPRFFEFFHANLRDHLLVDVLSRAALTPPAWSALDRLSAAAHEWDQTLKPLNREDVVALMNHREHLVEPPDRAQAERIPFYLLFMRDAKHKREALCNHAMECLVFSAIVAADSGAWAFRTLYPGIEDRIALCRAWLQRTGVFEYRDRILLHLVAEDRSESRACLVELILEEGASAGDAPWSQIARILATPLCAARYRAELVVELLAAAGAGQPGAGQEIPARVRDFIVAACNMEKYEVTRFLSDCADLIETDVLAAPASLAATLRETDVDAWLRGSAGSVAPTLEATAWDVQELELHPIEVTVGSALQKTVTREVVAQWQVELEKRLGVPVPAFSVNNGRQGDADNELQLRIRGREIAAEDFYPPKWQVLARHWQREQKGYAPTDIERNDSVVFSESMLWLDPHDLSEVKWTRQMRTAEQAIVDWLEVALRRNFADLLDEDLFERFVRLIEPRSIGAIGVPPGIVRDVVLAFVAEAVPTGGRWPELVGEIRRALEATPPPGSDLMVGRLRARLGRNISEQFADEDGQLSVILVHEDLQSRLIGRISDGELRLGAGDATRLGTDACLLLNDSIREHDVLPVVTCVDELRLPLRRMLGHFDPRVVVLSYSELSPDLHLVEAGMLFDLHEPNATNGNGSDAG